MSEITLQFCSFPSGWGRVIPWFTQAPYSVGHVDIVLPSGDLLGAQHSVIDGVPAGVQIRNPGYGKMTNPIRVSLPVTPQGLEAALSFAHDQIGKPYDTLAIFAFMIGRNWRDDDAWYCSEYGARYAEIAKAFPCPLAAPDNKITPGALLLVCSALAPIVKV